MRIQVMQSIDPAGAWHDLAHDHQRPPDGDWTTWLILGGRGAGKTRAGAEWIRAIVERPRCAMHANDNGAAGMIALVAQSYADAREVMIEGPSGVRAVCAAGSRPEYEVSRRRLVWPNGAVAHCFSAEDPDGLRGYQFDAAWSDELCAWRYPDATWSNLQLALRLGTKPRQLATTTPRPSALIKRLIKAQTTAVTRATSFDNAANLSQAFFTEITAAFEGTALARQELYGEIIEETPGALWTWSMIETARISAAPKLSRIVVSVDPAITSGPDADECGVVVAGVYGEGHDATAYVLADRSTRGLSPRGWAERVIAAYDEFEADRIVVEANQGGEMARDVIAQIDPSAAVKTVYASRGKRLRAEPVAALYERGRVRHVGAFAALEDQMASFDGNAAKSPDRLDALVWAIADLMLRPASPRPGVKRLV